MKVILSVDPVRFPLTGIGRYTWELARQLQTSPDISTLRFFSGRHFVPELPTAAAQGDSTHRLKQWVQRSHLASEAYRRVMFYLKARALKGYEDHLYHGTNFFLPPFAGRRVATFHDLSPFKWTECNTPQRIRYSQKELLNTIRWADALITDSEYTRIELAEYFGYPLERIHTVPLASSEEFYPRSHEAVQPTLNRYKLQAGHYTLFVGTIEPRKNILTLLDAYSRIPQALRKRWPLVLSGYHGWRSEIIHQRIQQAERQGWARYIGFTPAEDLPDLFAGARLFAFPSLYEGFGLPVLEAMASGIPVVSSNSASLPEIYGDVALSCQATDAITLSLLLHKGLEDEQWRALASTAGLQRASHFSWQRCSRETLYAYQKTINFARHQKNET